MTKQETIQVLQSIEDRAVKFPDMTACDWVAIAAAKRHLENILEEKEVDLEEEINHWQGCEAFPEDVNITPLPKAMDIVERTAKHFFELGLNTQKGK